MFIKLTMFQYYFSLSLNENYARLRALFLLPIVKDTQIFIYMYAHTFSHPFVLPSTACEIAR